MESPNEECPICLSCISTTDTTNDIYITQCCKKTFHHTCYIECMKIKTECPLCRAGQVVIFVNPINGNENNTNENNNTNTFCYGSLRYWAKTVCVLFMCFAVFDAMFHYAHKN